MILHHYVKNVIFTWGGEIFYDKQAKWPIAEENHQNIHPQLIHMTLQDGLVIKLIGFKV
jgi:hypothetical protein